MTSFIKTALAAVLSTVVGLSMAPATLAQDRAPAPQPHFQMQMPGGMQMHAKRFGNRDHRGVGDRRGGGLLDIVCSERGSEKLEIAFVRLSHRLDLTDAQTPLFDDLKATALTAQTTFSDECAKARPAKDAATRPDMVERLKAQVAIETAHLAAINTVLPKLDALYASLTDEQKAGLQPKRDRRGGPKGPQQQAPMGAPADAPAGEIEG